VDPHEFEESEDPESFDSPILAPAWVSARFDAPESPTLASAWDSARVPESFDAPESPTLVSAWAPSRVPASFGAPESPTLVSAWAPSRVPASFGAPESPTLASAWAPARVPASFDAQDPPTHQITSPSGSADSVTESGTECTTYIGEPLPTGFTAATCDLDALLRTNHVLIHITRFRRPSTRHWVPAFAVTSRDCDLLSIFSAHNTTWVTARGQSLACTNLETLEGSAYRHLVAMNIGHPEMTKSGLHACIQVFLEKILVQGRLITSDDMWHQLYSSATCSHIFEFHH
jgi:hypothetical protein